MPIEIAETGSPGWWFNRLFVKLHKSRERYDLLDAYYTNQAAIPITATKATKEAYRRLMAIARTNYAELVVEPVRQRMQPTGFRTGANDDELGDKEAWRIWQANSLDADSLLVHRTQLSLGDAYVIVGGPDQEIGAPLITPEDPREVVTEHDPRYRRRVVSALKLFRDDIGGRWRAYLYLPGLVYQAYFEAERLTNGVQNWQWGNEEPERLPSPVVPVVRFANRANIYGVSKGEFESHLPLLDRINYQILHRLEIITLQAFRQRAIKGVPEHDAQGNEVDYDDIFSSDPGAMWHLPAAAEIWESGQVDIGPIHTAVKDDVMALAAVTETPLFYLTPDAANGSAEGASLMRESLVGKTKDRIVQASESWEQVMALAFLFAGDEVRANRRDMECLWESPERFSLAERYDAATKAMSAGVPWRAIMTEILQFSPQQVNRMEAERATDLLLGALSQPPAEPTPEPVPSA